MIHVNCPDCGRSYLLQPTSQGKVATCKECGSQFSIPRTEARKSAKGGVKSALRTERRQPTDPVTRIKQVTELLERIDEFPHPSVSIGYRINALFVAIMMLLLPMLYLGFIASVAWLTWWHITNNDVWMTVTWGRAAIFAQLLYIGLSFAGVVWVLSLIKPLFKSIPQPDDEDGLDREEEPALFAFAEALAEKVGAPQPEIIHLIPDCNAFATFKTTSFGLQRKEFTLAVGVPLIAGLTLPQLAGVMAHEFGHFSQRGGTFQRRVIGRINRWFMAAVYDYDWIDEVIAHLTDEDDSHWLLFFLGMVLWCLVGLGRMVLWCLMMVGLLVSGTLMRRAEFDADRYETALIGSKAFEESSERIVALNIAHEVAKKHAFEGGNGQYLPKDFPAFIVGLADKSQKVQKTTRKLIKEEKLHLMASHPPTRSRIAAANKLDEPGVFHTKLPGSALIGNFQSKCADFSAAMYEDKYGDNFFPNTMRPTPDVIKAYLNTMERK